MGAFSAYMVFAFGGLALFVVGALLGKKKVRGKSREDRMQEFYESYEARMRNRRNR